MKYEKNLGILKKYKITFIAFKILHFIINRFNMSF